MQETYSFPRSGKGRSGSAAQKELRLFAALATHGGKLFNHGFHKSTRDDTGGFGALLGAGLAFNAQIHIFDGWAFGRNGAGGADFSTMHTENTIFADFMCNAGLRATRTVRIIAGNLQREIPDRSVHQPKGNLAAEISAFGQIFCVRPAGGDGVAKGMLPNESTRRPPE